MEPRDSGRTSMKSSAVRGPEETKRENCWCIRGIKGERLPVGTSS